MNGDLTDNPADRRPDLVVRVGITGTREFMPGNVDRLRRQVHEVLRQVREAVARLAASPEARLAYKPDAQGRIVPVLHILSPLADGADRLVAAAALDEGYILSVPMPFAQATYEATFRDDDSIAEFRGLLAKAGPRRLELDGADDDNEARSYEAVGRLIVRNCDLLIALWDGKPGRGRGGTAEIVRFSASFGPPVWWLDADNERDPIWVSDGQDLIKPHDHPKPGAALSAMHRYLKRLILPPHDGPPHPHLLVERLVPVDRQQGPLSVYYAEQVRPVRWYAEIYDRLMRLADEKRFPRSAMQQDRDSATEQVWRRHYREADRQSGYYAKTYRAVYTWVFLLGALALIAATVSLAFPALDIVAEAAELLLLLIIFALVVLNHAHQWHRRWIDYRLLAELCRKQEALAAFAWSLPGRAVESLVPAEDGDHGAVGNDGNRWVAWLFSAYRRMSPLPAGQFSPARVGALKGAILRDLIDDQLHYHDSRQRRNSKVSLYLARTGEIFFLLVLLFVVIKLALLTAGGGEPLARVIGLFAVILPALAAGSVGFRSYAELQVLSEESRTIIAEMTAERARVHAIDPALPLASQDLGGLTFEVATTMLRDIEGWARLFRIKVIEAG